jgi:hypothetical protein
VDAIAWAPLDLFIYPPEGVAALTINPALDLWIELVPHDREGVGEFGSDNDMFGRHNVDGVGQRLTPEIGVNQRNRTTDAGYPEPDGHVFRTIWHEQTHDIASRDSLLQRPMCILIGPLRKPAVCQAFSLGKERGR